MQVAVAAPPNQIKSGEASLNVILVILTRNNPYEVFFHLTNIIFVLLLLPYFRRSRTFSLKTSMRNNFAYEFSSKKLFILPILFSMKDKDHFL